jgi:hypothetical protein
LHVPREATDESRSRVPIAVQNVQTVQEVQIV